MSVWDGLNPTFMTYYQGLLADLASNENIIMKPYFGLRDPVIQCKLWRQSRTTEEVNTKLAELDRGGAKYLRDCLINAGPQPTKPWETNAIGGFSWHQYGEAMDAVWMRNGKEEWSTELDGPKNGYIRLMAKSTAHNLHNIGVKDAGHIQLKAVGSPGPPNGMYTLLQVNQLMKDKFGGTV